MRYRYGIGLLIMPIYLLAAPTYSPEDLKQLSLYQGYLLYTKTIAKTAENLDFEQICAGIKQAQAGTYCFDEKEMQEALQRYQRYLFTKKSDEKLEEANAYLKQLANQEGITQLEQGKLYYRILKSGHEPTVSPDDAPLLSCKIITLGKGGEEDHFEFDEPKSIKLSATISGFAKAVTGMLEGERRIIYVHPDLGYGVATERAAPNALLIFDVEIIKSNPQRNT